MTGTVLPDVGGLVIAQLQASATPLTAIQDAADFAVLVSLNTLPERMPCAWVIPLGDDATANDLATRALRQTIRETVAVVIVNRRAGDATGAKARAGLMPAKAAVIDALIGWTPDGCELPVEYRRTRLQGMKAGAVFLQVEFAVQWKLRKTQGV